MSQCKEYFNQLPELPLLPFDSFYFSVPNSHTSCFSQGNDKHLFHGHTCLSESVTVQNK